MCVLSRNTNLVSFKNNNARSSGLKNHSECGAHIKSIRYYVRVWSDISLFSVISKDRCVVTCEFTVLLTFYSLCLHTLFRDVLRQCSVSIQFCTLLIKSGIKFEMTTSFLAKPISRAASAEAAYPCFNISLVENKGLVNTQQLKGLVKILLWIIVMMDNDAEHDPALY